MSSDLSYNIQEAIAEAIQSLIDKNKAKYEVLENMISDKSGWKQQGLYLTGSPSTYDKRGLAIIGGGGTGVGE